MPLPLTNLDDTQFQTMVANALTAIPRYAPEWTDYNLHDPGITFIELFAWLTEMQQYYMNRIRGDNYLRFLKLLGVRPADVTPARATVVFNYSSPPFTVPKGQPLSSGNSTFETTEPLTVIAATLEEVVTVSQDGRSDNTTANNTAGTYYMAFGNRAEAGSTLYLGFSKSFSPSVLIPLTISLSEEYPVPRASHGNEPVVIVPSARIVWEYYNGNWAPLSLAAVLEPLLSSLPSAAAGLCGALQAQFQQAVQAWPLFAALPSDVQNYITSSIQNAQSTCALRALATDPALLDNLRDETVMLSRSGRVFFIGPHDMLQTTLFSKTDNYYWIRARVAAQGYEVPPRINQILLNAVTAVQTNTLSEVNVFSGDGTVQSFPVVSYLALQGDTEVQLLQPRGLWQQESSSSFSVKNGNLTFVSAPAQGNGNIRLIACPKGSSGGRLIGQGNGLPNQQFPVPAGVVPGTLQLLSSTAPSDSTPLWQDWLPVDNFDAAGPEDYQFIYDPVNSVVRFGDGVNGAVPPTSQNGRNVRWVSLQLSQGSGGNGISLSSSASNPAANLTWATPAAANGGADPETLAAAELRARRDLNTPFRAVTTGDFEYDTIHTPGLRVSRAQAIPSSDAATPNTVQVVVVPYSTLSPPTPSKGFLQTVCRHLMIHRLITTKLQVSAPVYITVTVQATVTLQAGARSATVQQAAISSLTQFLDPLIGGPDGTGWPFGRTVYESDIYQILDGVPGLGCVQTLTLSASGAGANVLPGGDVQIPPESLVVSGNHSVTVASAGGGVCPPKGGCK